MSSGPGELDTEGHDVGLAETMSPAPGEAPTRPSEVEEPAEEPAEGLGGRPVSDRLVRAVSRAKIAGALFASEERVKLGRYHLLELVGAGGMGVVWGAWDPELDRRVAIKLVKATMQSARDRILLEGQALAKLSHPNVVPVFDVGVVDEQVYLVMEWVRGKNLRAYCKVPRSVREIVAVYRDAALGLTAAHHAGLIHRDFKPDNAIRGDDGRVRVLDFGLAREGIKKDPANSADDTPVPSSDLTRGAGTPRYMPPEQAEGGELTPTVDQYAWCVSLREALVGRDADGKDADIPGWLDAIITRGTSHDARARYASMDELLRALGRDPRTIWRRRAIVTGALGLAGAAFAVGTVRGGGSDVAQCGGGKDEIAKTWNDQTRSAVLTHVGSLGEYGKEESQGLEADLSRYAAAWAESHRAACQARARGELTPQLYERSVGCLARANTALQTVIGVLTSVPRERLSAGVVALRELPRVARCATAGATDSVEPPPPEIAGEVSRVSEMVERARVLANAADSTAREVATKAVAEAERLKYAPLIATAQVTLGFVELQENLSAAAIAPLAAATETALEAGDDILAVEAFAREIFAITTTPPQGLRPGDADAPKALSIVEPLAKRIGIPGAFARTLLYNNVAVSKMAATQREEAKAWFTKALEERRRAAGERNLELARVAGNLALAVDDEDERARLFAESVGELTELVGANHPFTLATQLKAAMFVANPVEAAAQVRVPCERYLKYHPHLVQIIERCAFELGWLSEEHGDRGEARTWMARVTLPEELKTRVVRGYLFLFDHEPDKALAAMEGFTAELAKQDALWVRAEGVDAYLVIAVAAEELHKPAAAVAALERSVAILEPAAEAFPSYERRLARSRAMLARHVAATDPERAAVLARAAIAWYRPAGGYESLIAELERLVR